MRFIQIIYKEERCKTYGIGVYMLGILFFYGVEYFIIKITNNCYG